MSILRNVALFGFSVCVCSCMPAQNATQYPLTVHVSSSWFIEPHDRISTPQEGLRVVIEGKKFELNGSAIETPRSKKFIQSVAYLPLNPGDYPARIAKDESTSYALSRTYEISLLGGGKAKFWIVKQEE